MRCSFRSNGLMMMVNGTFVDLPGPSSLSFMWSFGSLLGLFLSVQVVTGMLLAMHYVSSVEGSFDSVVGIMRDVSGGWWFRVMHSNGASMFFFFIYLHMGRGLYYGNFTNVSVWLVGVTIFIVSMAVAFLGYVLPWGQMSYWAATVITNLLSAVPYLGVVIVEWVWGGFSVSEPTLMRFFVLHFLFPFVLMVLVIIHLYFLHESGSDNPLGLFSGDLVEFHPYYVYSDVLGFVLVFVWFMLVNCFVPYIFMDVENFIYFNPLVTPVHIQPEWYFLFAYAVLRSVPSKIGGVLSLVMSLAVLYIVPYIVTGRIRMSGWYYLFSVVFWIMVINWVLLTWIGMCVVEEPYLTMGRLFSVVYFVVIVIMVLVVKGY